MLNDTSIYIWHISNTHGTIVLDIILNYFIIGLTSIHYFILSQIMV